MMAKISLVPGYRFRPSDAELVCHYLKRKVAGQPIPFDVIAEIELYKFAPWDLPDKSRLQSKYLEWYFFCPQERKYPNGSRRNRTTDIGYWRTTGKDKPVIYKSRNVGTKKTLVFHAGKGRQGKKTDWAMYEYRLEEKELVGAGRIQVFSVHIWATCLYYFRKKSAML